MIYGPSETPRHALEQIADELMDLYEERVRALGGEPTEVFISLHADGVGEPNALTAGRGFEDGKDVFAYLIAQAVGVGKQLGLKVLVGPLGRG